MQEYKDKDTWLNINKCVTKLKIKYKNYINSEDALRIKSNSKAEQNLLPNIHFIHYYLTNIKWSIITTTQRKEDANDKGYSLDM